MPTVTFDTPALFGDHHVTEVRQILLSKVGVENIYASSGFRAIEVTFDDSKVSEGEIAKALEDSGYLGEIPMLIEPGQAIEKKEGDDYFRHTAVYTTIKKTISFAQRVPYQGRPLWPCPGLGVVEIDE